MPGSSLRVRALKPSSHRLKLNSVLTRCSFFSSCFQPPNTDLRPFSLSRSLQASSPLNSWLASSNACITVAETTLTMADPAPTERPMSVGYGFRPNNRELVGRYLHRKLMADDPSIHDTIPEIGVCKYEPRDLLAWAASAASATKFDDFQCHFFSPRDYKYCNGKQFNRTTSRGFWKVTGRGRKITDGDTNNVIGIKKTLVFYEGRIPTHGTSVMDIMMANCLPNR